MKQIEINYQKDIEYFEKLKESIIETYQKTKWYGKCKNPLDLQKNEKLTAMQDVYKNFKFDQFGRVETAIKIMELFR